MAGWWDKTPKTLAETGYFKKAQADRNVLRYMRLFYKTLLKPGRAVPFSIKRATLYTCEYVFPPSRGFPKGRACIDDVYGSPDPDCPACNGLGYPVKSDQFREIRAMGMFVPFTPEEKAAELFGKITIGTEKLIVGLPIPPEYTKQYGLKPKTDVLDKNGQVVERDVFVGYKIELGDMVVKNEEFWDGLVYKNLERKYIVTNISFNLLTIGYYKTLQVVTIQPINTGDNLTPEAQF